MWLPHAAGSFLAYMAIMIIRILMPRDIDSTEMDNGAASDVQERGDGCHQGTIAWEPTPVLLPPVPAAKEQSV